MYSKSISDRSPSVWKPSRKRGAGSGATSSGGSALFHLTHTTSSARFRKGFDRTRSSMREQTPRQDIARLSRFSGFSVPPCLEKNVYDYDVVNFLRTLRLCFLLAVYHLLCSQYHSVSVLALKNDSLLLHVDASNSILGYSMTRICSFLRSLPVLETAFARGGIPCFCA